MQLLKRLEEELAALSSAGLYRRLALPGGVDFSSNDYLGLANHPAMAEALSEALQQGLPVGSGGSRLLRGNHQSHVDLEERLAAFTGRPSHLLFSSGYEANLAVCTTLFRPGDLIFSDEANHASLIDGIRHCRAEKRIYPHGDLDFLGKALAGTRPDQARWIVTESHFSMEGSLTDVETLLALADQHGCGVVLDEAHATGLFGSRLAGLAQDRQLTHSPLVVIHTCGKALGCFGAFVSTVPLVRETLINRARHFIFSTAPPPMLPVLLQKALDLLRTEAKRARDLMRNVDHYRQAMAEHGFPCLHRSPIQPLILGSNERALRAACHLQEQGFDVRAIRHPTVPHDQARLRIAIHADHRSDQIDSLVRHIGEAMRP
jgi:8-amino-7-oxononanoate synthase